ncbi:efflux transporter outer membrane subunit [Paraburkholderia sp. J69-1]|nr:efflux transporter outer membrane subunit [Paraburkholderia sp. J69-1]
MERLSRGAAAMRLGMRLALGCTLASVMAGCVSTPGSRTQAVKPVSAYQSSLSLSPTQGEAADWPTDQWWLAYGDSQLDTLVDQALAGSPSVAAAMARLREAQAMEQESGAALKPGVTAKASVDKEKQSYNYLFPQSYVPKGWEAAGLGSLSLNWDLDLWGKNRAALAAATSDAQAAQADAAEARLVLATSVVNAYADLARLFAERDCDVAALKVRTQTAELFGKRREQGLETSGSVDQAIARREASEAALHATDESIALARNRIAALLGAGPDRGLSITRPSVGATQKHGLPSNLTLNLLGRRPDIVVARLRAQAASKRIDAAKAEFYPDINLSAVIGVQSLGLNMLMKSGSAYGSVGPAISLPIFSGGRLQGQYRSAQAKYDEAVASYDDTLVKALRELADATVSERELLPRLDATRAASQAAARAHDSILARYQGGLTNYLNVLSAEDSLIDADRQLADLEARAFSLDVALVRALGGGFQAQPQ